MKIQLYKEAPKTIDEMLRSRQKHPILSKEVIVDICKRIKKLERKK